LHFLGAPAFFLLLARTLMRFRFVVSLHGDDVEGLPRGKWFDRWVFRATLRRADAVTACSRYLLNQAQALEPSIARKARVIYNGADLPSDAPAASVCDSILGVGRMVPKKGFDVLLRAMAQCQNVGRSVRLTLIGEGPERRTLESLAHDLGLDGRVDFRGDQKHSEVVRAMAASRIVVIPSRQEPFGLVALEAMTAGKPVVATCVGGLPEVLEGADALMVEPENPVALANALASALARIESEPNFGARNREIAARFSAARMVDQYTAIYRGASFTD
jgi:glycosyltransferase involved in cell wall biosynthesis